MRKIIATAAAATAFLAVAGCSSSSTSTSSSPSATSAASSAAATSAAPTDEPSGDITNPVLPPIEIDGAESVDAKVGDTLNVTTTDAAKIETDNPAVLSVSQPGKKGSAEFNGGATVLAAGSAKMMVYDADGKELYTVEVTAKEATN